MTVLIVDDDVDFRDMVALVLSSEGFETETAADGERALASLRRAPAPSVVFLDLRMPGLNGFEVLSAARSDAAIAAIPIVVMTGDSASVPRALAAGAVACLVKPLDADEIVAVARRFTGCPGTAAA
ncbi:MAG TPA: response regulator [Planctomycetota bacterium]|nr:response regulator [Planctomycetota bacterium]